MKKSLKKIILLIILIFFLFPEFWIGDDSSSWRIIPLVPWSASTIDLLPGDYPPLAPNWGRLHYLGTDSVGRDLIARLVYGLRYAFLFSSVLFLINFSIGLIIGGAMGYWGGLFDLIFQRIIEILSHINILYLIIIISSLHRSNFFSLIVTASIIGWTWITFYVRTLVYKEKEKNYIFALQVLGASPIRILLFHIFPNIFSSLVTLIPFQLASGMILLVSLDFLKLGVAPPTPSLGDLLRQGSSHLEAYWIGPVVAFFFIFILIMINFIGERLREKYDPRKDNHFYQYR